MKQNIIHVTLVVNDYDEALDFYCNKLQFEVIEDTEMPEQNKRWVVIAPPSSNGVTLLLAKASNEEQQQFVGNQTGGRVSLFLQTDDIARDYQQMQSVGVEFLRVPTDMPYGTVAVFADLYGNKWDLLQLNPDHPMMSRI